MNDINDDLIWDVEIEIDDALRSAPLAAPPPELYARVMEQVARPVPLPRFRLTFTDLAVSLAGSFLVSMFLAYFVFMPAPLRLEMRWLAQWVNYLANVLMVWILPCLAAAGILVSSLVLVRRLQTSR